MNIKNIKKKLSLDNKRVYLAMLGFLILTMIALRFINLGRLDLWRDEAFTAILAQKPLKEVIQISIADTNPPLHKVLLHIVSHSFGNSEFILRLPSALFSIGTGIYLYLLSKLLLNKKWSLVPLALYTFNFISIFYAQEARSYSMLTFLLIGATYHLLKGHNYHQTIDWILFGVFSLLSVYTHNLSLFYIPILGLYSLIRIIKTFSKKNRKLFKISTLSNREFIKPCISYLGILILSIPWLLQFVEQAAQVQSGFWLSFDTYTSLFSTLMDLVSSKKLVTWKQLTVTESAIALGSLSLLVLGSLSNSKKKKQNTIALIFWGSLILQYFASFKSPILYARYQSFLIPYIFILVTYGVRKLTKNKFIIFLIVILLIGVQLNSYRIYNTRRDIKPCYTELTLEVDELDKDATRVLHNDAITFFPYRYYHNRLGMSDQSISHIVDPNKGTPYYLGKALMTDSDFIYNLEEIEKERLIIISMGDKLNIDYTNLGYKETSSKDFCGNIYITTFEKPN